MREILLVEDNEIIVKGLKYLLEQEKFDIKIAKNIVDYRNENGENFPGLYEILNSKSGNGK